MLFQKEKDNNVVRIDRLEEKKERRSVRRRNLRLSPMSRRSLSGKVSLCAFKKKIKKASLAVETAMVLPLFFFGVVTMISFMDIYRVQTAHLTRLCQNAKKMGMYAYGVQGPENIVLPDIYSYQPISGMIPVPKIWMHNTIKVHAWTGVLYEDQETETESRPMVYITESGTVYHKKIECSYLNISIQQISGSSIKGIKNAYGESYQPCELCSRGQGPAGSVYITQKSNRYHNQENCSGLKRSVRMVKESEISGNLSVCSRCG